MARLYLVRHGEAAAGWGDHDDPGLSALGAQQAAEAAAKLAVLAPKRALTSPLLRCRETAAAFEMESGLVALMEPAVREVPTPPGIADRRAWLRGVMSGRWSDMPSHAGWRAALIETLARQDTDAAIFTHYVAINVAVGACLGEDAVTLFAPANGSITVIDTDGARLHLVARGGDAASQVL